jgi:uncharacterized membrane protein
MISRYRLDALTDGVFSVAMTLLVIDIKLPEGVHPHSAAELIDALARLDRQFFAYALSFIVLGMRWLGLARGVDPGESASMAHARWTLLHLFLVTCLPFSTMVVGRYGNLAPAICLYAGNMLPAAVVAFRLGSHAKPRNTAIEASWRTDLMSVIILSVLVMLLSFYIHAYALLLYLLTAVAPLFRWSIGLRT